MSRLTPGAARRRKGPTQAVYCSHAGVLAGLAGVLRETLRTSTDNADAGSVRGFHPGFQSIPGTISPPERAFPLPDSAPFPNPFRTWSYILNANPQFLATRATVDLAAIEPLPQSRKIHETGSRPDIRVPFREIRQDDTPTLFGGEPNPPLKYLYKLVVGIHIQFFNILALHIHPACIS